MLNATKGFIIVKRAESTGILQEVQDDRTNKGIVVSQYFGPEQTQDFILKTIYYVPHSALPIQDNDGKEYFAVPEGDIVAILSADKTE